MKHHITINKVPLCETRRLNSTDVYCNHITKSRAKTALLRLIEQNPTFSICSYKVEPGVCAVIAAEEVGA